MKADAQIWLYVQSDAVTAAHLRGRKRESKPAMMFGRAWTVRTIKDHGDRLLVMLETTLNADGSPPSPLMCKRCGSFDYDQPGGHGDPFECSECPNKSHGGGVLF